MKRKTAKELLAESFRELAQKKSIDKITVRDITVNCGYSSATFYRQFKDKYDLIAWAYSRDLAQIMKQITFDEFSWKQTLSDAADYYKEHEEYLSNLLLHTSGYVSFIRNMTEINYNALKSCIMGSENIRELDETTDMYIRGYCLGTVSLTCEWILGKYKASPGKLAEIYDNFLPGPLRQYLC